MQILCARFGLCASERGYYFTFFSHEAYNSKYYVSFILNVIKTDYRISLSN